jgi:O-antigen ligase
MELRVLTSSRFPIWVAYAKMGLSTPLGVGYWQGPANFGEFDEYFGPGYPPRPAHSLYLQVFGEFGWFGYLLLVGFLLRLTTLARRAAPAQLPLLLFLLSGYSFYSGLSDWAFWIVIGYVLACVRVAEPPNGAAAEEAGPGAAVAGDR